MPAFLSCSVLARSREAHLQSHTASRFQRLLRSGRPAASVTTNQAWLRPTGVGRRGADEGREGEGGRATGGGPSPRDAREPADGDGDASNIEVYNEWVKKTQLARNDGRKTSSGMASELGAVSRRDTPTPPPFSCPTLFQDAVEEYTQAMTSEPSSAFQTIAEETNKAGLFAPCMVGAVEGEFLSMIAAVTGAKRILDIGTFTGYSALAFADGAGAGSKIVTVEADAPTAEVARRCFAKSSFGDRIHLVEGDARKVVRELAESGEMFDIVFLDADKTNYRGYYEDALRMVDGRGVIMADNALCSLLYDASDPVRTSLHEFAQFVRADARVKQVMLTVREGILMVRKV